MDKLRFAKMHGLGNDFMVISTLDQKFEPQPEIIRQFADRRTGIGFDQLMLISAAASSEADFSYRIFNADGNEVEQCGNGVRCVTKFIQQEKLSAKKSLKLAAQSQILSCTLGDDNQVTVMLGQANFDPSALPFLAPSRAPFYDINFNERLLSFGAVSVGNPHIVMQVPDVQQAEVDLLGQYFNDHHPLFPRGVNVGFMEIISPQEIRLRVYERGAGETLACGTGACAAVSIARLWSLVNGSTKVHLSGGTLTINIDDDFNITMTGPVVYVYRGEYIL